MDSPFFPSDRMHQRRQQCPLFLFLCNLPFQFKIYSYAKYDRKKTLYMHNIYRMSYFRCVCDMYDFRNIQMNYEKQNEVTELRTW